MTDVAQPRMTAAAQRPALIRLAAPGDAEGIRQVYAPFAHTPVTFEEVEPDPAEFRGRMEGILAFYPGLVACKEDGRVVGFAYAHRQSERAAYDWNAELSIYLADGVKGRGLGSAIYGALMRLLTLQGVRCAYARVTLPNAASEALHARFGFERAWVQRNAGFKNGAWRDVAWLVKPIGPFDAQPARPLPFPRILEERAAEASAIVEDANAALA